MEYQIVLHKQLINNKYWYETMGTADCPHCLDYILFNSSKNSKNSILR